MRALSDFWSSIWTTDRTKQAANKRETVAALEEQGRALDQQTATMRDAVDAMTTVADDMEAQLRQLNQQLVAAGAKPVTVPSSSMVNGAPVDLMAATVGGDTAYEIAGNTREIEEETVRVRQATVGFLANMATRPIVVSEADKEQSIIAKR
jgi:hypothetical protein